MSDGQGSLFETPPVCPNCANTGRVFDVKLSAYVPCRNVMHDAELLPDFDGATYSRSRDHIRLGKQAARVWHVLLDGQWHTLSEIAKRTGDPEASISARIRDLRKPKFGGNVVEHENLGGGRWRYRLREVSEEG